MLALYNWYESDSVPLADCLNIELTDLAVWLLNTV
jgi:hypothetical protein